MRGEQAALTSRWSADLTFLFTLPMFPVLHVLHSSKQMKIHILYKLHTLLLTMPYMLFTFTILESFFY